MPDLPKWLEDYAQDCRKLFGLDEWEVSVKLVRAPGGDDEREGHAEVNFRYLSVKIELNETMSEEGFRHILMHEMLHATLAPIEQAFERTKELVKKGLRNHVDEMFADGLEQAIERLTRALQREIKPTVKVEDRDGS